MNVFEVRLEAGGRGELILPAGQNSAIVLLRRDVVVNGAPALKGGAQIAHLSPSGESVLREAKTPSLVLVLSGGPLNKPVVRYNPFAMNTEAELRQAFERLSSWANGSGTLTATRSATDKQPDLWSETDHCIEYFYQCFRINEATHVGA